MKALIKKPGFHYLVGIVFGLLAALIEAETNFLSTGGFSIDGPWVALVPMAAYAGKALIEYLRGEQAAQLAQAPAGLPAIPVVVSAIMADPGFEEAVKGVQNKLFSDAVARMTPKPFSDPLPPVQPTP